MKLKTLSISGAFEIELFLFVDSRGRFVKTFHQNDFYSSEIDFSPRESFWSESKKGDIRGMHVQAPPKDNAKLVICQKGEIIDVLLDLRRQSPTYGHYCKISLSDQSARAVYVPKGVAHGFQVLSESAMILYYTSMEHSPQHDLGIRWDSFGFDWPHAIGSISDRDRLHPAFADFVTPF